MGKGLGLTAESKGKHIAFAAGTGVLVFVDLVARIALQTIDVIPREQCLNPQFELELFVSFQNKEDAIALEMMELLSQQMQLHESTKFILHTRFSDQKDARWDDKFLVNNLKGKEAQKIWVCGPPLMEESFDKYLCALCPDLGIDFKSQVDIM